MRPRSPAKWKRYLQEARRSKSDVIFDGDSITESWRSQGQAAWDRCFAPLNPANLGIGGDKTIDLLRRLRHGQLDDLDPTLYVLLIGTNDLSSGATASETAANVGKILDYLKAARPRMKILLIGILPRNHRGDKNIRSDMRPCVARTNLMLSRYADGRSVHFLDVGGLILDNQGRVSGELTRDFLHLSAKGYDAIADAIAKKITRLLKGGKAIIAPAVLPGATPTVHRQPSIS